MESQSGITTSGREPVGNMAGAVDPVDHGQLVSDAMTSPRGNPQDVPLQADMPAAQR